METIFLLLNSRQIFLVKINNNKHFLPFKVEIKTVPTPHVPGLSKYLMAIGKDTY